MSTKLTPATLPGTETQAAALRPDTETWGFRPLPYREVRRRIWHMSPGVLAFGLHLIAHRDPISATMRWIVLGCCVAIGLKILTGFRQIQRQGEGAGIEAVAGYALSVLLTVLMFPGHLEIGISVLSILAFGDGSATLIGMMFRGPRLPWNAAKSWSGFLGFTVVGTLMTSWIYWGETRNPESLSPAVSFAGALLVVTPAVVVAAVAESAKSRLNDNVRVGIISAAALSTAHFLFRSL